MRLRSEEGVTTIESAIVMVVLLIVTLATIPLIGDLLAVNRARGAAEQVTMVMRLARQHAVATRATYAVTMTATTIQVTCQSGCPGGAPSMPSTPILHDATLAPSVTPVQFLSDGSAQAAAQVTVTSPGAPVQRVCVSVPGRIVTTGAACP
jgi:type II secretory pathway pseudopilin PulG